MDQLRTPVERLSFDIFRASSELVRSLKKEDQNFVVGVFGAASAAAMIYVGSGGVTADKLKRIMHFDRLFESRCTPELIKIAFRQADLWEELSSALSVPVSVHQRRMYGRMCANLTKRPDEHFPLEESCATSSFQVFLANRAYIKEGNEVRTEFCGSAKEVFNTEISEMQEFKGAADLEKLRVDINEWVNENTGGYYPEMLPPMTLIKTADALTRMFIINLSFLRAKWNTPFARESVKREKFTNVHGKKIDVEMMHVTTDLAFFQDTEYHVKYVEIPYANNEACLCLMMPYPYHGHRGSLKNLLRKVQFDFFMRIAIQKKLRKVDLKIPKFKVDNTFDLKDIFTRIGMRVALEEGADFSNMLTEQGFYLTGAFHKCSMQVDEYGSTADFFTDETTQQAESADWPEGRSSHPEVAEFHADHPFIFTVRHNLSGLVLFVGRVCDFPSQNIRHRRQTHAARPSDLVDNLKSTFTGRERRDSR